MRINLPRLICLIISLSAGSTIYSSGVEWSRAYIQGLEDIEGEFRSIAFTDGYGVASSEGSSSGLFETADGYNWKAIDQSTGTEMVSFKGKTYSPWGSVLSDEFNWEAIAGLPIQNAAEEVLVINERILYVSLTAGPMAYSADGSNWVSINATTGSSNAFSLDRLSGAYVDGYYYLSGGFPDENVYKSSDLIHWLELEESDLFGSRIFGLNGNLLTMKNGSLNRIDSNLGSSLLWPLDRTEDPSKIISDGVDYYIAADKYAETIFHLDSNFNELSADTLPEGGWIENIIYDPFRNHVVVAGGYLNPKTQIQRPTLWIRNNNVTPLARGAIQFSSDSFYSDWFGLFWELGSEWIFSERAKNLYVFPSSSETSTYFYSAKLGWLWTNQTFYPHIYAYTQSSWIYMMPRQNGSMRWWNFSTETYESEN